jgi:tRNA modification GTPase
MTSTETIAAIATSPGRGAIGIVRVSGRNLQGLIEAIAARSLPPRHAVLCEFRDAVGATIDQGIALYFPAPASYTGEDVLELQGHGGPVVTRLLLNRCQELGARIAQPGEFTKRAFLNDRIDLAQAEAVIDLIDAASEQAARCAMRSLKGEFSKQIQSLNNSILNLRTLVEANLDFPEEEVEVATIEEARNRLCRLAECVDGVLAAAQQGSLLREGLDIVLAGQPNVGKSSLLNRLAGEDLAIVTEVPGTTRDVIRQSINLEGIPVRIVDTAGLRSSTDPVESLGIARSWDTIANADVVVLMIDATCGETRADEEIVERLPRSVPCIRAFNKIDLTSEKPRREGSGTSIQVWMSAKTGAGVDLLRRSLLDLAGWRSGSEGIYLARERHLNALSRTRERLVGAAKHRTELELVAEELRLAQSDLSVITGEHTADDLLGSIFARFCIGK